MELTQEFLHSVEVCPWLAHCGEEDGLFDCADLRRVADWETVLQNINSLEWENTCLAHHGNFTAYLSVHHPDKYNRLWNKEVCFIKEQYMPAITAKIEEALRRLPGFPGDKVHDVVVDMRFNVLTVFMLDYYGDLYRSDFCERLWDIYQSGHLPCYYEGEFPQGKYWVI